MLSLNSKKKRKKEDEQALQLQITVLRGLNQDNGEDKPKREKRAKIEGNNGSTE